MDEGENGQGGVWGALGLEIHGTLKDLFGSYFYI
jgi:hypothetical protein